MAIQANPYPLRIDPCVMAKIKVMAAFGGRSANKEIEFQLRKAIAAYEAEHGRDHPAALPRRISHNT